VGTTIEEQSDSDLETGLSGSASNINYEADDNDTEPQRERSPSEDVSEKLDSISDNQDSIAKGEPEHGPQDLSPFESENDDIIELLD
jgi:hypothetical protein